MSDAPEVRAAIDFLEPIISFSELRMLQVVHTAKLHESIGTLLADHAALAGRLAAADKELEIALKRMGSVEMKSHLQTLDERDSAEEAISHAYFLVHGKSPQWSNLFGHEQALEEIKDGLSCLRQSLKEAEAQLAINPACPRGIHRVADWVEPGGIEFVSSRNPEGYCKSCVELDATWREAIEAAAHECDEEARGAFALICAGTGTKLGEHLARVIANTAKELGKRIRALTPEAIRNSTVNTKGG